jgi:uncharacterized protein (DUF1697 family)
VPSHVALLRGINVGGRNKVAMPELRRVVSSLGHQDVSTYIQSGNVLFTARSADTSELAAGLEQAIAAELAVRPGVVVVSRDELAQVVRDTPYPGELNPKAVHVLFMTGSPAPGQADRLAAAQQEVAGKGSRDTVTLRGRVAYLHTPDGYGRSDLGALLARGNSPLAAGQVCTARNWATVSKLLLLCEG